MATLEQLRNKRAPLRQKRYFSEEFRKKKVDELDKNITTIAEICRQYQVSGTAVYKWIYKYSLMRKKSEKMVVESASDTQRIKALKEHISQLEQLLGQKQFEVDFLNKQMEILSDQYGVDFKKKASGSQLSGSGKTEDSTSIE